MGLWVMGVLGSKFYGLWVMGVLALDPCWDPPPPPPCEKMMVAPSRSHLSGAAGAARKGQSRAAGAA